MVASQMKTNFSHFKANYFLKIRNISSEIRSFRDEDLVEKMEWMPAKFNREFLSKNVDCRADSWKQWHLIDLEQWNLSPLVWQSGDWIWINTVRHEYYVSDGWVLTQLFAIRIPFQEVLSNLISLCLSNYYCFELFVEYHIFQVMFSQDFKSSFCSCCQIISLHLADIDYGSFLNYSTGFQHLSITFCVDIKNIFNLVTFPTSVMSMKASWKYFFSYFSPEYLHESMPLISLKISVSFSDTLTQWADNLIEKHSTWHLDKEWTSCKLQNKEVIHQGEYFL